jgi:hypothetical protein
MEMMNGENPAFTNLVGASALPSHTAAASPQNTPSLWREMVDRSSAGAGVLLTHYLNVIKRVVPRINTTTGTQRCRSVSMQTSVDRFIH